MNGRPDEANTSLAYWATQAAVERACIAAALKEFDPFAYRAHNRELTWIEARLTELRKQAGQRESISITDNNKEKH